VNIMYMSPCNPNEPAFAAASDNGYQCGLTKREYFAALFFQSCISNTNFTQSVIDRSDEVQSDGDIPKVIAKLAIEAADSLIAALNKVSTDE
jgi:hypothetical protein